MEKSQETAFSESIKGKIAFLGSGETTRVGRQVLAKLLAELPDPRRVAVLDTPAGFQPNHIEVATKIVRFLQEKLAEFRPDPHIIETAEDPLATAAGAAQLRELARARCVVAGPGSPSYMIRKLAQTLYLDTMRQIYAQGGAIFVSSAATIAMGALSIPVYEIFKVGEDPHWLAGLDFLGPWGMHLAIVPHWNNGEGGAELDTRFCYMGQARFELLRRELPAGIIILGIDEHTACLLDWASGQASVEGKGSVHLVRDGHLLEYGTGESFPLHLLGADPVHLPDQGKILAASSALDEILLPLPDNLIVPAIEEEGQGARIPPFLIERLLTIRSELRGAKQWAFADQLRDALTECGIVIEDTPAGSRWHLQEDN